MGNNNSRHFRCARKRQLQVVSSCPCCRHISPHYISVDSCDRPGRHLIHCIYSCQSVQFVGNNSFVAYCTRKRQLQVVPSCPRCRHILHSLHSCRLVRPTRSPFFLAHSLRVNSCNSWAKKIFPNNSWAIIHSLLIAPAKGNFKLSQVVPVVVIYPPSLH